MTSSPHQMETLSALLALCVFFFFFFFGGGEIHRFPSQRQVTRNFDVFFVLRLNKRLSKQSRRRWFETQSRSLWRHCNEDLGYWSEPSHCWAHVFDKKYHTACCPACRTTFIATRFRVAVICPIIQVPHCIRVFFYFVWFVFINHIFQFYNELCTYCNILDIYLS